MRRSLTAAGALIVLAALAFVPAAAASPPSPGAATAYRIGILEDFDGINPFSAWSGPSWECFRLCYNFLTWYDREYRPVPELARSWETSADGRTWTFHIIDGMKWQDGVPLTAADIAFTYNLILETQDAAYAQYLSGVTSVTAPDHKTLVIQTRKPSAGMLAVAQTKLAAHFVLGRAEQIPLPDNSFDFLTMGYALRHVTSLENTFHEYRRVLKPGGKLLIMEITG